MNTRRLSLPGVLVFAALALLPLSAASAAPAIHRIEAGSLAHTQVGATLVLFGEGFEPPLQVLFSDGANPVVPATEMEFDQERGLIIARVPAGAASGGLIVNANGFDSDPYLLVIDPGTFDVGTRQVGGTVSDGTDPVEGALVILLAFTGCDDDSIWNFDVTDAGGNYTLEGQDGGHIVYVFPPLNAGVATGGAEVGLGPTPATADIELDSGVLVQGRVVLAVQSSTGVPNARLELDSDSGFDTLLTDANGYYTLRLNGGDYEMDVLPGDGWSLSAMGTQLSVGAVSPQQVDDMELHGGVEITGLVRRQSDLTPLANLEIEVQPTEGCCQNIDSTVSRSDGSFRVIVPPNQSYNLSVWVDEDQPLVDLQMNFAVGSSDMVQNLDLSDAAFITGQVTDAVSGQPLVDVGVQASLDPNGGMTAAWANSCEDGSFRLRVPPSSQGYIVSSNAWEENGYVPVTWNNTPGGTFFPCNGVPVAAPTAGLTVAQIDLPLEPGAGSIEGAILTQDSSCTQTVAWQSWVNVDDGSGASCNLGVHDWNMPPGQFRVHSLPHSGLVPGLRVCVYDTQGLPPQCYNLKAPPAYDEVVVPAAGQVTNVNFCLGNRPVLEVPQLMLDKVGGLLQFAWSGSGDPYHDHYRLRGSGSATPSGAGDFPNDPQFDQLSDVWGQNHWTSMDIPYAFFLVTEVGSGGAEGPAGSYGN